MSLKCPFFHPLVSRPIAIIIIFMLLLGNPAMVPQAEAQSAPLVLNVQVSSSNDDAEEGTTDGKVYRSSTSIELGNYNEPQLVGLKFNAINIPSNAQITNAYIQFTSRLTVSNTAAFTIHIEDTANAAAFGSSNFNISSRPLTSSVVNWSPGNWILNEAGIEQRTPDISTLIQEVINRPDWVAGNAVDLIVKGNTGYRKTYSFDNNPAYAPKLYIEYIEEEGTILPEEVFGPIAPLPNVTGDMAGYLAGNFGVSETGTANYTINLTAPPGTSGVAPKLALNYDSRGSNSVLGLGWSLSGMSAISRCSTTMAQDGFLDGVDFDDNDKFCLDGQRMVAINGTYGAHGTEYRTENESFVQIFSYGTAGNGPQRFVVKTKSGLIYSYGNTADSRIEAQGKSDVLLWHADRIKDTVGNYMTVSYYEDNTTGENYPLRVDYTGNDAKGLIPYNSVRFVYEPRNDISPKFLSGSKIQLTKRLKEIQMFTDQTKAWEYRLTYDQSIATKFSRLETIQECDVNNVCLSPTTFDWSDRTLGFETKVTSGEILNNGWFGTTNPGRVRHMDVNGDGKVDLAAFETGGTHVALSNGVGYNPVVTTSETFGNGWFTKSVPGRVMQTDVNADGRTDLVAVGTGSVKVALSNGIGFNVTIYPEFLPNDWFSQTYPGRVFITDVNGDGLGDLVGMGTGVTHVALGNGVAFQPKVTMGETFDNAWFSQTYPGRLMQADVNADGKTDLVTVGTGVVKVALSNGIGFNVTSYPEFLPNDWFSQTYPGRVFIGDVNGDGLGDLVGMGTGVTHVALGNGVAFEPKVTMGETFENAWFGQTYPGRLMHADVNADGKTDLVAAGTGVVKVALSNGIGFDVTSYPEFLPHSWFSPTYPGRVFIADVNGDGLGDFVGMGTGVTHISLSKGPITDKISQITNGHGSANDRIQTAYR